MGGAERVVDIDSLAACELVREVTVVGLFLLMEAEVFEQDGVAWGKVRDHPARDVADTVRRQRDLPARNGGQPFGDRLEAAFGVRPFRPAEMASTNNVPPRPRI